MDNILADEVNHKIKEEVIDPKAKSILHEAFLMSIDDVDGTIVHSSTLLNNTQPPATKQRHIYESPEARARRLARNAERMRERRANESEEEYRLRLAKMAEANRLRRENENTVQRAMRHLKDAARQRIRRAMESPEQRANRLAKLAERSRYFREHETPEQKAERRRKCLENNRARFQRGQQQQHTQTQPNHALTPDSAGKFKVHGITSCYSNFETSNMTPSPSGSSNLSPISGGSSYDQNMYSECPKFLTNTFPDLPPHLAPNQPKYYGQIQNFMPPNPTSLHYIPPAHAQQQTQIPAITSTTTTIMKQDTSGRQTYPANQQHISNPVYNPFTPPSNLQQPEIYRGRPMKILPSNDYQSIAPSLQEEAMRQQKLNCMLEEHINIIMTSPKSSRGRPGKGRESDPQRAERLRKMAELRRQQRDKETPDERAARLKDLADRARKRRETMLTSETEDERRERLSRQAEYARQRRLKCQTPQAIRQAEQKAKNLYQKLHN